MKSILQSSSMDTEFSKIKNLEIQRTSFIIFKYLKKKKTSNCIGRSFNRFETFNNPDSFSFRFSFGTDCPLVVASSECCIGRSESFHVFEY